MLAYLLSSPLDASVSLELLDDSAVHFSDGTVLAEQSKKADKGNPIANSSVEFWKTIWNWLQSHKDGELLVTKTRYVLYVNQTFEADIPLRFSDALTPPQATDAINYVKQWLALKTENRKTTSTEISVADKYVQSVLAFDQKVVEQLVCNFTLERGSGDAQDGLLPLVLAKAIRKSLAPIVVRYLQGWVKEKTDRLIANGNHAVISVQDFLNELVSFYRSIDVGTALFSTAPEPTQDQIKDEFSKIFVQQLDIIDQNLDDKLRAIDHYLRAAHDRTQWGLDFDVNEISFKAFERELQEFWDIVRQRAALDFKNEPDKEKGQRTYLSCRECQRPLQGMTTPTHFIQGSFHRLADLLEIGWHPQYKSMIDGVHPGEQ